MNLKDFTYGLILLVIPLILILIIHRFYVYNKCHYNKECIKRKISSDINNINSKLSSLNFFNNNKHQENNSEEQIEGFFGGFGDWIKWLIFSRLYGGCTVVLNVVPSGLEAAFAGLHAPAPPHPAPLCFRPGIAMPMPHGRCAGWVTEPTRVGGRADRCPNVTPSVRL